MTLSYVKMVDNILQAGKDSDEEFQMPSQDKIYKEMKESIRTNHHDINNKQLTLYNEKDSVYLVLLNTNRNDANIVGITSMTLQQKNRYEDAADNWSDRQTKHYEQVTTRKEMPESQYLWSRQSNNTYPAVIAEEMAYLLALGNICDLTTDETIEIITNSDIVIPKALREERNLVMQYLTTLPMTNILEGRSTKINTFLNSRGNGSFDKAIKIALKNSDGYHVKKSYMDILYALREMPYKKYEELNIFKEQVIEYREHLNDVSSYFLPSDTSDTITHYMNHMVEVITNYASELLKEHTPTITLNELALSRNEELRNSDKQLDLYIELEPSWDEEEDQ